MGSSLYMRRVVPTALERGVPYLEEGFEAVSDDGVYVAELESGRLCTLGGDWQLVNIVLTGEEYPRLGAQSIPVLGGAHIGSVDGPTDVLLWADAAEVREAHEFLASVDHDAAIERGRRILGRAMDGLTDAVAERLRQLSQFYRRAAQADEAVVKRLYGV